MELIFEASVGVLLPFLGTGCGAATVFFLRRQPGKRLERFFLGFAAGVMIAASVWSLLIPSIEMAQKTALPAWLPAVTGFLGGVAVLVLLDEAIRHLHPERAGRSMLLLAVTLHNIPEGMAVGVVMAGMLRDPVAIPFAEALALSVGIAIQNFPEGAIISAPLSAAGMHRRRAFLYGVLSGVVEPIGALLTILLTALVTPALPYILAFAAGAMIYVVAQELIPEMQADGDGKTGVLGVACGFAVMMLLDVALGG